MRFGGREAWFGGSPFRRGGHGHIYLHSLTYRLCLAIVKCPCTRYREHKRVIPAIRSSGPHNGHLLPCLPEAHFSIILKVGVGVVQDIYHLLRRGTMCPWPSASFDLVTIALCTGYIVCSILFLDLFPSPPPPLPLPAASRTSLYHDCDLGSHKPHNMVSTRPILRVWGI